MAPHAPEKSWRRGFAIDVVIVMVGFVLSATNRYQTSFLLPIPHKRVGISVYVDPAKVPLVFTQVGLDVSAIAPAQRSFAGTGSVIQILNVRAEAIAGE